MANWGEIKESVEKNGNVLTVTMEQLREATGAGKLGVNIRSEISRTLAGMGLGHVPQELPSYQHEQVRLYKHGTPVGELITTVLTPGQQNDQLLVERFGDQAPDYAVIVQKNQRVGRRVSRDTWPRQRVIGCFPPSAQLRVALEPLASLAVGDARRYATSVLIGSCSNERVERF